MPRLLLTPDHFARLTTDCRVCDSPDGSPMPVRLPPREGTRGLHVVIEARAHGYMVRNVGHALYAGDEATERILLSGGDPKVRLLADAVRTEGGNVLVPHPGEAAEATLEPGATYALTATLARSARADSPEPLKEAA